MDRETSRGATGVLDPAASGPASGGAGRWLPEDAYRFVGTDLRVRTNAAWVRDQLRDMYRRFFRGPSASGGDREPPARGRGYFEVLDRLDRLGELTIRSDRWHYALTRAARYSRFTRQDRRGLAPPFQGFCDAPTLVGAALLDAVAHATPDWCLFHAGALALEGRGVILPADSGRGKTTLTLELVRRGGLFLSDEVACVSPEERRLTPFPRRINLRRASRTMLGIDLGDDDEAAADIEYLYPGRLGAPCRPGYLVFLRGFADRPSLEPLSRTRALFCLLNLAIGAIDDPAHLAFRFAPLLDRMECYHLVAGSPGETADLVAERVSGRRRIGR